MSSTTEPRPPAAPGPWLIAMELRALWEFGAVLPAWPLLQRAPVGDGHPVIVFPGLSASDASTLPLRGYLGGLGYDISGWNQGHNFGPRAGVLEDARHHVMQTFRSSGGRPVSLIGWSLGGIYARELAKALGVPLLGEIPIEVALRESCDAGRPLVVDGGSSPAVRAFEAIAAKLLDALDEEAGMKPAPAIVFED